MKDLASRPSVEFVRTDVSGVRKARLKLKMSSEELRSLVHSTAEVLSMHGLVPAVKNVVVQFTDTPWLLSGKDDQMVCGCAFIDEGIMRVAVSGSHNNTGFTILHEWIHLCGIRDEWIVSTLTARFKEQVLQRASMSVRNYYKNAAFVAHRLISYNKSPEDPLRDTYNPEQYVLVPVPWDYKHRRKQ